MATGLHGALSRGLGLARNAVQSGSAQTAVSGGAKIPPYRVGMLTFMTLPPPWRDTIRQGVVAFERRDDPGSGDRQQLRTHRPGLIAHEIEAAVQRCYPSSSQL